MINAADNETQDYLWTIALAMGRISEINRLTWDDVDLRKRHIILYTRKKKGCHLRRPIFPLVSFDEYWGHENRTTTEIYLHSIGNEESQEVSFLEGKFIKIHEQIHIQKNNGIDGKRLSH